MADNTREISGGAEGIRTPDPLLAKQVLSEGLKEASGLSWGAMARSIGVDRKQLMRWRKKGIESCGGAMHAIFRFANRMSDGLDILMSDGSQMTFRGEER